MTVDTNEILQQIWSLSEGQYVFLPRMFRPHTWVEGSAYHPEIVPNNFQSTDGSDQYFTPLKYTSQRRRREFVGNPGILFADLDDGALLGPWKPNLLIQSSAEHMHAYWFLDKPYSLDVWEPVARGLSQVLGADPGGWDATQVLRVPGTLNHKYAPPHEVSVIHYDPEPRMPLRIFPTHPTAIRGQDKRDVVFLASAEEAALRADALRTVWPKLSLEVQSFLTLSVEQVQKGAVRDRSKVVWFVGAALLEAGATVNEAFAILNVTPWNKYRDRPKFLMEGLVKQSFQLDLRAYDC